jgi:hypothetical protein
MKAEILTKTVKYLPQKNKVGKQKNQYIYLDNIACYGQRVNSYEAVLIRQSSTKRTIYNHLTNQMGHKYGLAMFG